MRVLRSSVLVGASLVCAGAYAQTGADPAQSWPSRSLRVVVPFTAGSGTDAVGRLVTERLATQLGQNFVIENRPGAGGTIGMAVVAKANPDGYTILVHSSSYTVTPTTYPNAPYDTLRDFSGITPLANLPNVLVVAPARGIRSVKELVAAAKAKPGSITYASAGRGKRDAVERGALPAGRRVRRRSRAVQGDARGLDRRDRRAGGYLFLSGHRRA